VLGGVLRGLGAQGQPQEVLSIHLTPQVNDQERKWRFIGWRFLLHFEVFSWDIACLVTMYNQDEMQFTFLHFLATDVEMLNL
jgi:hypothetical protein